MTPPFPEFSAPAQAGTEQSVLPPEPWRDAIKEIVDSVSSDEFDNERRVQLNRAKNNWLMVQGHHYLAPDLVDDGEGNQIVEFINVANQPVDDDRQKVVHTFNWIGGDCWKFVAVSGQAAPNCKAIADDPENPEHIRAAKIANANILDFAEKWDIRRKAREIAFHQYTTGPVFLHTAYVTDGEKYGYSEEPTVEIQQIEGADGTISELPVEGPPKQYPNGDAELRVCNVLEVTVPYGKKSLRECGWLAYEYMEEKWKLLSLYRKELAESREDDAVEHGTESAQNAERARSAVQDPIKTGKGRRKHLWLFKRIWLRPYMLEGIKDKELRAQLKQQFPTGLRVTLVKDKIVALDEERMDDAWAIVKTGRGEYITENPLCQDSVSIQKAHNKFMNLQLESLLRSIPKTLVDANLLDPEAWAKNAAVPMEVIPVKAKVGESIDKGVAQLPAARVSDQIMPFGEAIRAYSQDISGIRPEIAGGGPPTATFREARQRRDQALMQLGPPADEMDAGIELAYENGVKLRAKYGTGTVSRKTGQFGETPEAYDMSEIALDGWHIEADEGFPMSFADRADEMRTYLKEFPPEVQQYLGLLDPVNVDQTLEILQIRGFKSPMKDERDKTLDVIRQLLAEAPIQQMGMDGIPMEMPTIPPEMGVDNHPFVVEVVKKWCNSEAGRSEQKNNKPGYANVKAYLREQDKAAMMTQAPPPGAPPSGDGKGGPPPNGGPPPPPQPNNSPLGVKPDDQAAPLPPLPEGPPPIV